MITPHDVENCKVDNCFKCKCATFQISASATPTRRPDAVRAGVSERAMVEDLDAYTRFRKNGVQPKGVNGAAAMEQAAHTKFEVESGRLFKKAKVARKYEEMQHHLANGGLQPLASTAD